MKKRITLVPENKLLYELTKRLLKSWIYLDYNDYQYLLNDSCNSHDISSLGNIQLTWETPPQNFPRTTIVCEPPVEQKSWVKISSIHFGDVLNIFYPPAPKYIYFFKLKR